MNVHSSLWLWLNRVSGAVGIVCWLLSSGQEVMPASKRSWEQSGKWWRRRVSRMALLNLTWARRSQLLLVHRFVVDPLLLTVSPFPRASPGKDCRGCSDVAYPVCLLVAPSSCGSLDVAGTFQGPCWLSALEEQVELVDRVTKAPYGKAGWLCGHQASCRSCRQPPSAGDCACSMSSSDLLSMWRGSRGCHQRPPPVSKTLSELAV